MPKLFESRSRSRNKKFRLHNTDRGIDPFPYLEDAAAVAVAAVVVAAVVVVVAVAVARLQSVGGPGSSPCCGAW